MGEKGDRIIPSIAEKAVESQQLVAIQQNDVVDADFSEMAHDKQYQEEALAICREFEKVDFEALQLGESEYEMG